MSDQNKAQEQQASKKQYNANENNTGLNRFLNESKNELKRLGTQGSMELANALFNGSAFVPYGPGQYTPDHEQAKNGQSADVEQQRETDGRDV